MVKHLPPSIKHLLTLRNPQSFAGPPVPKLNGILNSTFADARSRKAETGWLVLTTCTLLTANVPSSVGHLYRFATRSDPSDAASRRSVSEAVDKAALMRESALKATIFTGVPRTIMALAGLMEALEGDVKGQLRTDSHRYAYVVFSRAAARTAIHAPTVCVCEENDDDSPIFVCRTVNPEKIDATLARGMALWNSIYEPHAKKLYDKLGSYHPDFICASAVPFPADCQMLIMCPFLAFIIQAYGSVLSPLPGDGEQGNLSRALGSVVGVACLRAEGHVGPQLTSHVFGLLKARNVENLSDEDRWLSTDEGTEWVIHTIDSLLDVVQPENAAVGTKL
ncbi:hypothetical protein EWM64_g4375 [Hericium alpestre]|uniref:Uncharacterized protein n=1 Tax=Hericium alpestre TaxID=135208 RepID=A0A4Y9ZXP0_9AGAM|nr:hypothetical protein EWM64_g4375 [Hericium alpestre]